MRMNWQFLKVMWTHEDRVMRWRRNRTGASPGLRAPVHLLTLQPEGSLRITLRGAATDECFFVDVLGSRGLLSPPTG